MMRGPRSQRGITLLISLIMLVVLTLFATAMIRLSNTNVVVVGNMQSQRLLEAVAQQAIEAELNSASYYNDQIFGKGDWANSATEADKYINNYKVKLQRPKCIFTQKALGYAEELNVAPDEDFFESEAIATDPVTGATTDVVQGVSVILPVGNCVP